MCRQLPSFSPIDNSVKGEQFRCDKSLKGERASERVTGCTVAEGDLQCPATVFFNPPGPPSFIDVGDPNLRFFVFTAQFPFSPGFLFSVALCLVARIVSHFLHVLFKIPSSNAPIEFVLFGLSFLCGLSTPFPFLFAFPARCQPLCRCRPAFLILTNPPPPSALPISVCHFPGQGALCCPCLSISAVGTQS